MLDAAGFFSSKASAGAPRCAWRSARLASSVHRFAIERSTALTSDELAAHIASAYSRYLAGVVIDRFSTDPIAVGLRQFHLSARLLN